MLLSELKLGKFLLENGGLIILAPGFSESDDGMCDILLEEGYQIRANRKIPNFTSSMLQSMTFSRFLLRSCTSIGRRANSNNWGVTMV